MMSDAPVPLFRVQWQSRQNDPGNRYVTTQHTAERIAAADPYGAVLYGKAAA